MREIDIDQLAAAIGGGAVVVDVRETGEYAEGHVPGARNIPMAHLTRHLSELDRTAVVHVDLRQRQPQRRDDRRARGPGLRRRQRRRRHRRLDPLRPSGREGLSAMTETRALTVVPIETPTLGDRSYLVHDGEVAFVVDPQRDIDRVLDLLDEHDVRLTHVFETHIHNDYVTGGLALAQATGAAYLVNGADEVSFERTPMSDGEVVEVGDRMRVTALATPGHTFTHLSYALRDLGDGSEPATRSASSPAARCSTAPPAAPTCSAPSTPTSWSATSTRRHTGWPTCCPTTPRSSRPTASARSAAATQSDATSSTIGAGEEANPVLTQDEETYVRELLAGLGAWPAYYAHMAPANAAGPSAPDLSPPARADAAELRRRIEAGEWVVDLRNRTAFAAGHAPGTLNFGLDGGFATYLGWLIPWGTPITLLGETRRGRRRGPARAGPDRHRPPGRARDRRPRRSGATDALASFADRRPSPTWPRCVTTARWSSSTSGAPTSTRRPRIDGAVNVPLHELCEPHRRGPGGRGVGALRRRLPCLGRRLDARRAGRTLVAIDDSFDNAEQVGLHLVGPEA